MNEVIVRGAKDMNGQVLTKEVVAGEGLKMMDHSFDRTTLSASIAASDLPQFLPPSYMENWKETAKYFTHRRPILRDMMMAAHHVTEAWARHTLVEEVWLCVSTGAEPESTLFTIPPSAGSCEELTLVLSLLLQEKIRVVFPSQPAEPSGTHIRLYTRGVTNADSRDKLVKAMKEMITVLDELELSSGGLMIAGKLTSERKEALSKLLKELV